MMMVVVVVVVLDKSVQETMKTHRDNMEMCEYKKLVDLVVQAGNSSSKPQSETENK